MRAFDVLLYSREDTEPRLVGHLAESGDGRVGFRLSNAYRGESRRPVLGQQFEDDLRRMYVGTPGRLPAWFANLIPEGPVREVLERSLGIASGDDLGLLGAVGGDLPGAVVVRAAGANPAFRFPDEEQSASPSEVSGEPPLRFSVAGVQMKFSVLRDGERVVLPATDTLGQWLVKLDSASYPGLVENEHATMTWARAAGFDVPETAVRPFEALPSTLRPLSPAGRPVYLVRRYDRDGAFRTHQEDLAQVVGLYPACKYGRRDEGPACRDIGYGTVLAVLRAIGGGEMYREALRRLVLMLATGNSDAHLKNWSLLYTSPSLPALSPLYDQVAVVAWEGDGLRWALPWGSTRGQATRIRMSSFTDLATRLGESAEEASGIVVTTLDEIVRAWNDADVATLYPDGHADAIRQFWRDDGPLLRSRHARLR